LELSSISSFPTCQKAFQLTPILMVIQNLTIPYIFLIPTFTISCLGFCNGLQSFSLPLLWPPLVYSQCKQPKWVYLRMLYHVTLLFAMFQWFLSVSESMSLLWYMSYKELKPLWDLLFTAPYLSSLTPSPVHDFSMLTSLEFVFVVPSA
jgi:hypothetical protein